MKRSFFLFTTRRPDCCCLGGYGWPFPPQLIRIAFIYRCGLLHLSTNRTYSLTPLPSIAGITPQLYNTIRQLIEWTPQACAAL